MATSLPSFLVVLFVWQVEYLPILASVKLRVEMVPQAAKTKWSSDFFSFFLDKNPVHYLSVCCEDWIILHNCPSIPGIIRNVYIYNILSSRFNVFIRLETLLL